jgi:hypothetical protein
VRTDQVFLAQKPFSVTPLAGDKSEFADFDDQEEHAQKQSGVCADLVPKSRVPLVTVGSCR